MDAVNVRTPYYDTCAVIGVVSASSSKPCTADQWFGHTTLVSSTANVLFTIHQSLCSLIGNLQYHRAKGHPENSPRGGDRKNQNLAFC